MPQYQGVWTLPVAARLQSTQQWATDPLYRNTTLLLQADNAANGAQNNTFLDSSSNNFTITRNGNTTQGTFTPFSATGWGNYFDGTGDYLSVASATALNLSTGDLTVEGWIYMNALPAANAPVASKFNAASPYTGWTLGINSSGYPYIWFGTTYLITSISTVAIGVWHHLALVRSGTTVTLYVNGTSVGTATSSANLDNTGTLTIGIEAGNANGLNGYVSNSRVVKGTAVYTANFNPSTSPLTAITNTSLLTCQSNRFVDNSSNAFAVTVTGTPSVQAFSPFAPQYQYTPSVTGGSGYFDGTGDYLTMPDNAAFSLGSGDFTVEAWIYPTATGSFPTLFAQYNGSSNSIFFSLGSNNTNLECYIYGATNITLTGTSVITLNAWQHVAIVRNGNTFTLYRNGISVATNTTSLTVTDSTALVTIGGADGSPSYPFFGYISNLRFVKGTAVYTGAFTPPIAPVTTSGPASSYSSTTNVNTTFTSTNTSLLCNFTNAGIYDGTLKNNLETVGNAQVSTSVVKYGTGSMYFDGTGDYLRIQPSDLLATWFNSDYTIEYWVYPNAFASSANGGSNVYSQSDPASTSEYFSFGPRASGVVVWYYYNGAVQVVTSGTISTGVWTHLAWTYQKSSNTMRIFINGVLNTTTTIAGTPSISTTANPILVGASTTVGFNGYIDDLRITKGVARYTANFTPPTVALPRQ